MLGRTPTLAITRGLPASGKTTLALQLESVGFWVVGRDGLRSVMRSVWRHGDRLYEDACTVAQHASIDALLGTRRDVVADDTNLDPDHIRLFERLASARGARFVVYDFTYVALEVCVERDAARTGTAHVGEEIIRAMHAKYLAH